MFSKIKVAILIILLSISSFSTGQTTPNNEKITVIELRGCFDTIKWVVFILNQKTTIIHYTKLSPQIKLNLEKVPKTILREPNENCI